MDSGAYFVFAGRVYERRGSGGYDWGGSRGGVLRWAGGALRAALVRARDTPPTTAALAEWAQDEGVTKAAIVGACFSVGALVAVWTWDLLPSSSKGQTVPKLVGRAVRKQRRRQSKPVSRNAEASKSELELELELGESASESKGTEERAGGKAAALAGQLKSLSAVMSAERAAMSAAVSGSPGKAKKSKPKTSETMVQAALRDVQSRVRALEKLDPLQYCYQVLRTLKVVGGKTDSLLSASDSSLEGNLVTLKQVGRLGVELGAAVSAADARNSVPRSVHAQFSSLHESLLSLHALYLETLLMPSVLQDVEQALSDAESAASAAGDNGAASSVGEARNLAHGLSTATAGHIVHRLVSLSLALGSMNGGNAAVQRNCTLARSYLRHLTGIANELVNTQHLLKVVESVREVDTLVEGQAFSRLVCEMRKASTRLWPEPHVYETNSTEAGSASNGRPRAVAALVAMHVLARKEIVRRLSQAEASSSMHDVAVWKHLVNACQDMASVALQSSDGSGAPGSLGVNPSELEAFCKCAGAVIERITARNQFVTESIAADPSLSFDNLILDSTYIDRRSVLADLESVTLLGSIQGSSDSTPAMRAIHAQLTRVVDGVLPLASVAVSVGSSTGGAVTASLGSVQGPERADVVVCFLLGGAGGGIASIRQLTFVRSDLSPSTRSALMDTLEAPGLGGSVAALAHPSAETVRIMDAFDTFATGLAQLSSCHCAIVELPVSLQAQIKALPPVTVAPSKQLDKIRQLVIQKLAQRPELADRTCILADELALLGPGDSPTLLSIASIPDTFLTLFMPEIIAVVSSNSASAERISAALSR